MRKFLILGLLFTLHSFAQSTPSEMIMDSNEELLERAKIGRHEYIDVIHDIKNYFFKPRNEEIVFNYMRLLEQLNQIEIAHKFPVLEVTPIQVLASRLLVVSLDNLDVFNDPKDIFDIFLKWATEEDISSLMDTQIKYLRENNPTIDPVFSSFKILNHIYDFAVEKRFRSFLISQIQDVETAIVRKLFDYVDLNDQRTLDLIKVLKGKGSLNALLEEMQIRFFKNKDLILSSPVAKIVNLVYEKAIELDPRNDTNIFHHISEFSSKIIIADIDSQKLYGNNESLLTVIMPIGIDELYVYYQQFNLSDVKPAKAEFLAKVLTHIKNHYSNLNLLKYDSISHKLSVLKVKDYANKIEGTYNVKIGNIDSVLTIFKTSNYELSYVLTMQGNELISTGSFAKVEDDGEVLIAENDFSSQRINGEFHIQGFIKFNVQNNIISGIYSTDSSMLTLSGRKVVVFNISGNDQDYVLKAGNYKFKSNHNAQYLIKVTDTNVGNLKVNVEVTLTGLKVAFKYPLFYSEGKVFHFLNYENSDKKFIQRKLSVFKRNGKVYAKEFVAGKSSIIELGLTN